MMYCKVNAMSVTKTNNKKSKFTTTPKKVDEKSTKKPRTKKTEQTESPAEEVVEE